MPQSASSDPKKNSGINSFRRVARMRCAKPVDAALRGLGTEFFIASPSYDRQTPENAGKCSAASTASIVEVFVVCSPSPTR